VAAEGSGQNESTPDAVVDEALEASTQSDTDVDTVLKEAVVTNGPFLRTMLCRPLKGAIENGGDYMIEDVAIVKDGVLLASEIPPECPDY
jgi:hypothetical protein